jgi:hypothetical protein
MTNLVTAATRRLAQLVGQRDPLEPSRTASFVGVATLTTSRPDVRGPFARPVTADLSIDSRGGVTVTSVYVEPVRFGSVTCTITLLPGTWRGTYVKGELQLAVGLHLGIDVLRGAEDSDITVTLTKASDGSRSDVDGTITVTGTATFDKGYLGGRLATIVVTGAIVPDAGVLQSSRRVADGRPSRSLVDVLPGRAASTVRPSRAVA